MAAAGPPQEVPAPPPPRRPVRQGTIADIAPAAGPIYTFTALSLWSPIGPSMGSRSRLRPPLAPKSRQASGLTPPPPFPPLRTWLPWAKYADGAPHVVSPTCHRVP